MQTNRFLTKKARKEKVFTTIGLSLNVSAIDVGGQIIAGLSSRLVTRLGRELGPGDTVGHNWIKGAWRQTTAGDLSPVGLHIGIGVYTGGTDIGDFPDLAIHAGDWLLHDSRTLFEHPATGLPTAGYPMLPTELSALDFESSGMREMGRQTNTLFLVVQTSNAPSAGVFVLDCHVTTMWHLRS